MTLTRAIAYYNVRGQTIVIGIPFPLPNPPNASRVCLVRVCLVLSHRPHSSRTTMESSPPPRSSSAASVAGVKRSASLLPAFEPLSSSPTLPRPQKRVARDSAVKVSAYPTPVPTSSTHIMSSSPPRMALSHSALRRVFPSMSSERAPLSAVPTLTLPDNGETISMGRSSASCHHQLSSNRMISRVHVHAAFKPAPNPFDRDRVEIRCVGWNGIKLHCQGKTYDLAKGKTFTSDIKDADVMIDVHDARVLVQWPRNDRKERAASTASDQTWDEDPPEHAHNDLQNGIHTDHRRLASPVSPSPARQSRIPPSSPLLPPKDPHASVVVYEDESSPSRRKNSETGSEAISSQERVAKLLRSSQSSDLSDLSKPDDVSDHDEENDPIVHSFGPFGENLLPRMASFSASDSPTRSSRPSGVDSTSPKRSEPKGGKPETTLLLSEESERIQNHVVNQLAFSRLSSTPLSTILQNLPTSLWKPDGNPKGPSKEEIQSIIETTKCIGKVAREGKDAAGKPLESEYYYIADFDSDDMRRDAVVNDLRKPGLRACRKQHKV